jgi:hypothetical protein
MDIKDCLPEYFAIERPGGYNVYQNTVYESSETHHLPACVLWPIINSTFGVMNKFIPSSIKKATITRRWNSSDYYPCEWKHIGSEVEMTKVNGCTLIIPVIHILESIHLILPYNNKVMQPISILPGIHTRKGIDIKARFFTEEPRNSVEGLVKKSPPVIPIVESSLPLHVKKILIANAVRNKDDCPISCDPITLENAAVTSCGHVFITNEIKKWLSIESSKGLCPSCKQKCSV